MGAFSEATLAWNLTSDCYATGLAIGDVDSDGADALLQRVVRLYELLYVDKYSPSNPTFTTRFIEKAVRYELFTVFTHV